MVTIMDDIERRNMIDAADARTAELIADMARRRASPPLEHRMASRPVEPPAPKTQPRPAPRPPARPPAPRLDRSALEALANATGNALGRSMAALEARPRAELAKIEQRADRLEHELAALVARVDALERAKRGARVVDMRAVLSDRRATG